MDKVDIQILEILQKDGRATASDIAKDVKLSIPAVSDRIKKLIEKAHSIGALVLVDGAQGIVHGKTDVQDLDCDFYGFTGHKIYGPSGIGVLYAKADILDNMPPYQGGGDMIERVSFSGTTFKDPPYRFEAGPPPIVQAIGLKAALQYVSDLGLSQIEAHEQELLEYGTRKLKSIRNLKLFKYFPISVLKKLNFFFT